MSSLVQAVGPQGFGTYRAEWSPSGVDLIPAQGEAEIVLTPGFVDLHFHGAFGIDLMSAEPSEITELCERLEAGGYEAFLATTVSAGVEAVQSFFDRLPAHRALHGVHLEGPFISPRYPGAQPSSAIQAPPTGPSQWDAVFEQGQLRLVTLAPEVPGGLVLVRRLSAEGIIVSMGHTDATYAEACLALQAGARQATHTFNAMRPLHHRDVGILGFSLLSDDIDCELIYDRLHVSPEAARLLLRCKGPEGVVAVSDSTMATGMPPGTEIEMWGLRCMTGEGEVRLAESGRLAGSAMTLLDAFRNLLADFGAETAIRLCSLNPRRALGLTGTPKVYVEMSLMGAVLGVRRIG